MCIRDSHDARGGRVSEASDGHHGRDRRGIARTGHRHRACLLYTSSCVYETGPGRIGAGGTSIILNNEDGVENGLKLQILDTSKANQPVEILPALVPPLYQDAGNFGQLMGDHPAAAVHTYTASLTPDPGKELKLGKYSAQVLVRVSYY